MLFCYNGPWLQVFVDVDPVDGGHVVVDEEVNGLVLAEEGVAGARGKEEDGGEDDREHVVGTK